MSGRYLLRFGYIGTCFKASSKLSADVNYATIAGAIEWAFRKHIHRRKVSLRHVSPITISSRTDAGVHAIQNTAHIDLIPQNEDFSVAELIISLNKLFGEYKIPIRFHNICQVSSDFNARKFAKLRTYLYRVGIPKHQDLPHSGAFFPASEIDRCFFSRYHRFDIPAVLKACPVFLGTHDFTSFTGKPSLHTIVRTPIRRLTSLNVCQGQPLMNPLYELSNNNFDYWDFIIEGRSFTFRQVRRIVSALLQVAQRRMTTDDIQTLIEHPAPTNPSYEIVPPHGLYLLNVKYDDAVLAIDWKRKLASEEHLCLSQVLHQFALSLSSSH